MLTRLVFNLLALCCVVVAQEPARAIVLHHDLSWQSTRWPGVAWTRAGLFEIQADRARFTVNEPGHGHVWSARLQAPIARQSYPLLSLSYRAHAIAAEGFLLWLDDGRGPVYSQWMPLSSADVVSDGQTHTLQYDLREHGHGDRVDAIAIAIRSTADGPAWLELVELRFDAVDRVSAPDQAAPVTVRVLDQNGDPLPGATVVVDAERRNWSQTTGTNAQGVVRLSARTLEYGQHAIHVSKSGYATWQQSFDEGLDELTVHLPAGIRYGGQVFDVAGLPMKDIVVQAQLLFDGARWWQPIPAIATDEQGQWRTPVLPRDDVEFDLHFSGPDVSSLHVADASVEPLADGTARFEIPGTQLDVHRAVRLGMSRWLRDELTRDPSLAGLVKDGDTPLFTAARFDQNSSVDVLVEFGAQVDAPGGIGTALHRAVQVGSLRAARQLLVHGANPDTRNASDSAPIHHAIWAQSDGQCTEQELLDTIDLLVEFGADMNAVHGGVGTPLDYATRVSSEAIIASLRAHGSRPSEESE